MAKPLRIEGKFVSFVSRFRDCAHYRVEDKDGARTLHVYPGDRISCSAAESLRDDDVRAVRAMLDAERAEFQSWLAANPDLAIAYAKLSV